MPASAKRKETTRSSLINIRVPPADRNIIDRAARVAGKTRSQFMLQASRQAAHDTLLDMTLVTVDAKTFRRFKAMLDAPAKPNKRLQEVLRMRAPWDHDAE
jgi:uncharacterized protein (DUF1778 family)